MDQKPAPAQPSAFDQAVALYQQGKFQEALEVARQEVATLANVAGAAARQLGLTAEAERYWRAAIEAWPGFAEAYNNLGVLLRDRGLLDEAEAAYRQVIAFRPQYAEAHYNLGNLLHECQRLEEAEAAYRQALSINPRYAEAYNNLGMLLQTRGCLKDAERAFGQALAIYPQYADARFNLSLLLLLTGRFDEGWAFHEARYDSAKKEQIVYAPTLPFPQWKGEALHGKSLLVVPEQGYGDQIQFSRYINLLKKQGASRIDLVCDETLAALFSTLDGIGSVIVSGATIAIKRRDYWTFPLSAPCWLKTTTDTIPAHLPYLYALPERVRRWAGRLPAAGRRVGLVWKGSAIHKNDAHRSLPGLRTLAPLWSVPGVTFVSLQKGAGEEEAAAPPDDQPLIHLGPAIQDFADTAAIIGQLDLVICVDTAIAHLAGALGKPCWVLLPCTGTDWRWMRERTDSPWYPGVMRLFRQSTPDDWAAVVHEVVQHLRG